MAATSCWAAALLAAIVPQRDVKEAMFITQSTRTCMTIIHELVIWLKSWCVWAQCADLLRAQAQALRNISCGRWYEAGKVPRQGSCYSRFIRQIHSLQLDILGLRPFDNLKSLGKVQACLSFFNIRHTY